VEVFSPAHTTHLLSDTNFSALCPAVQGNPEIYVFKPSAFASAREMIFWGLSLKGGRTTSSTSVILSQQGLR
jgi:hypothetical protein